MRGSIYVKLRATKVRIGDETALQGDEWACGGSREACLHIEVIAVRAK